MKNTISQVFMRTKGGLNELPPLCKTKLIISGSECYPESGMEIECSNVDCIFEGPILSYNKRTDKLKEALITAWEILNK